MNNALLGHSRSIAMAALLVLRYIRLLENDVDPKACGLENKEIGIQFRIRDSYLIYKGHFWRLLYERQTRCVTLQDRLCNGRDLERPVSGCKTASSRAEV